MSEIAPSERDIQGLELAARGVLDALRQADDAQSALALAGAVRQLLSNLEGEAARVRAELAHRIWYDERLTLTQLADRIGVSIQRAGQLVQAGKSTDKAESQ
jgi:hypothetical protein